MSRRSLGRSAMLLGVAGVSLAWWAGTDPRLTMRLDARTSEAVSAIVESAKREGVPTEPLIKKALEGASKRAAGETIIAVVRGYANDLRRAREALGPKSSEEEVKAGADALRAGVKMQELERLREAKAGQRFAVALDAMSYLVNRGVPADTASSALVRLVLASATDEQITALRADIERDIAGGMPSGLSTAARANGLEQVIAAADENGGAPGTALPSGRGSIGSAGLGVNAGAAVQGNAATGGVPNDGPKPSPRGKPKRP